LGRSEIMNAACYILRASKARCPLGAAARIRAGRRVLTPAGARVESAHSVARVTVAIPPQHISKR